MFQILDTIIRQSLQSCEEVAQSFVTVNQSAHIAACFIYACPLGKTMQNEPQKRNLLQRLVLHCIPNTFYNRPLQSINVIFSNCPLTVISAVFLTEMINVECHGQQCTCFMTKNVVKNALTSIYAKLFKYLFRQTQNLFTIAFIFRG